MGGGGGGGVRCDWEREWVVVEREGGGLRCLLMARVTSMTTTTTSLQKSAVSLLLLDQVGCCYARDSPLWECSLIWD